MQPEDPVAIRIVDAARLISISRSRAYLLAKRGQLPGAVRLGGTWRVSRRALLAWANAPDVINESAVSDVASETAKEVGLDGTQHSD